MRLEQVVMTIRIKTYLKLFCAVATLLTMNLKADDELCTDYEESVSCLSSSVCLRGGAYIHTSNRYHEIYGRWGSVFQIELTRDTSSCWQIWGNLDGSTKEGRSDSLENWTRIYLTNLSGGVKVPYRLTDSFVAYAGIGPSIGAVFVNNHFPSNQISSNHKHETKLTLGLVLKSGLHYDISCRFYVDLFLDYHYLATKFRSYTDLSGFKTGVGIGYRY